MLRKIAMALENAHAFDERTSETENNDFSMIADPNDGERIIKESESKNNIDSIFVEWCLS